MAYGLSLTLRAIARPAPEVISEQPYRNRAERRHGLTATGKRFIVKHAARQSALNVPYVKP